MSTHGSLLDDLRDGLTCDLSTTPEVLERYGYDYGAMVRRVPAAVVHARSEQDVAHTLRVARAHQVPVSVRGAGHTSGGQSLCEGSIVLESHTEQGEVRLLEGGRVEVTARTRWADVEAALNDAGRTMPVLTSSFGTTVGGTLSVGGYGSRSLHHGAQVDHVERLRLVLPDGTTVWCGPGENEELFRFSLAGFGQVGIIERVVLRTLPYQPHTRLQLNPHASLGAMVEAVAWTADWEESAPEHFFGLWKEGRFWSVFGLDFADASSARTAPAPEPLRRMTEGRVELEASPLIFSLSSEGDTRTRNPTHRRLWCDYCFDLDGLRRFVAFIEQKRELWNAQLDTVYLLGLSNPDNRMRWPFDMRSGPWGARRLYALGLYYGVRTEDREALAAAQAAHRMCMEWSVRAGGRPYLYGWNRLAPDSLQALYGEEWARLRALRHSLDPHGLLNPHGLSP